MKFGNDVTDSDNFSYYYGFCVYKVFQKERDYGRFLTPLEDICCWVRTLHHILHSIVFPNKCVTFEEKSVSWSEPTLFADWLRRIYAFIVEMEHVCKNYLPC